MTRILKARNNVCTYTYPAPTVYYGCCGITVPYIKYNKISLYII